MKAYELMVMTNHCLIKDEKLTENRKYEIANELMAEKTPPEQAQKFYIGVKYPNNIDQNCRRMYPFYFIPPYNNGKKYKTILNQTPKTHILSANMYELEILRLLYLFLPENNEIQEMVEKTLDRLKTTCFGYDDDGVGECFDASIVALRFLATVAPDEKGWIKSRIDNYNKHCNDKKRPWFSLWYYWLCLSELPFDIARFELDKYKDEMMNWLANKSCVMNSDHDKTIHPVLFCILRNNLSRYSEYEYIKNRQPYVASSENKKHNEKVGRLYFNME